jgi:DNA polymerase-3 subunit gamma/tau
VTPAVQSVRPAPAAAQDQDWIALVAQLQLLGPVSQLAAHCVMAGKTGPSVQLLLDEEGQTYHRPQLVEKLRQALAQHFNEEIRLQIDTAAQAVATPARRQQAQSEDALKAARESIDNDPNVRAMRDIFGATVNPDSVKPLR